MRLSINVTLLSAFYVLSFACLSMAAMVFEGGPAPAAYTLDRQIRYSFTLENTQNTPLEKGDLWVNIPAKQTATQWCLRVNASEDADLTVDSLGNRVLHFKAMPLPPYGARIIRLVADLKLASASQSVTGNVAAVFKQPGPHAESAAPEIVALARQLKTKGARPTDTAKAIYTWVSERIKHSGYHPTDRGALWALQNKQGDCSEFASLFTALCRADEIPARVLSGFTCPKNMVLKPYSLHNWAEFYDNGVWRLADPLERNFGTNQAIYVTFAIMENSSSGDEPMALFRFDGKGLSVNMDK